MTCTKERWVPKKWKDNMKYRYIINNDYSSVTSTKYSKPSIVESIKSISGSK